MKPGERVRIPVEVRPGPFDKERLVTFESSDGPVSGFVPSQMIIEHDGQQFIEAVVRAVADESISVNVRGSFFTTTGLAHVSKSKLQVAA